MRASKKIEKARSFLLAHCVGSAFIFQHLFIPDFAYYSTFSEQFFSLKGLLLKLKVFSLGFLTSIVIVSVLPAIFIYINKAYLLPRKIRRKKILEKKKQEHSRKLTNQGREIAHKIITDERKKKDLLSIRNQRFDILYNLLVKYEKIDEYLEKYPWSWVATATDDICLIREDNTWDSIIYEGLCTNKDLKELEKKYCDIVGKISDEIKRQVIRDEINKYIKPKELSDLRNKLENKVA